MRLSDYPMITEVKESYIDYRECGLTRSEATDTLVQEYHHEIVAGRDDDGVLFWIGLADGQFHCKEITQDVAEKGSRALEQVGHIDPDNAIAPVDIKRRKAWYAQAPMPERVIRKRKKYRCEWEVGDTFAYKVSGEEARNLGIEETFFLFRKVDAIEFGDGRLLPIVTITKWDLPDLPKTAEVFQTAPLLKISSGGRCGSSPEKFEYRAEILFRSRKQIESLKLQYLGNFKDVLLPADEIIFTNAAYLTMMLPEQLDHECCLFWKSHLYCSTRDGS